LDHYNLADKTNWKELRL